MWFLALLGAVVAIVSMIAGYLLGHFHGCAEGRAMWKAVFGELRDFDQGEKPRV
jgi:hypothetical protein